MGQILTKTFFSPLNESHAAKLCFPLVLKQYWANSLKTSLYSPNMTISEKSKDVLRKFVFFNKFEKGQILRKIWICLNNSF